MRDIYTVIKNPNNLILPFEVWVKGKEPYYSEQYDSPRYKEITKRISTHRTEQRAKDVICYWQDIQKFKEQVINE